MIVSAIAAIDRAGLIGDGVAMPWHLPRDLKRFRKHTLGKPVIMGRRTFETLRAPLDGRLNIVLTKNPSFRADGCRVVGSVEEALTVAEEYADQTGSDEVMIIGGGAVYAETVPRWDRLLLTVVGGEFRGSTFFPLGKLQAMPWRLVEREYRHPDQKNPHPHWFLALERPGTDSPAVEKFDIAAWLKDCFGPQAEPLGTPS